MIILKIYKKNKVQDIKTQHVFSTLILVLIGIVNIVIPRQKFVLNAKMDISTSMETVFNLIVIICIKVKHNFH